MPAIAWFDGERVELGSPRHQALLDAFLDELRADRRGHGAELVLCRSRPEITAPTISTRMASASASCAEELRSTASTSPGVQVLDLFEAGVPGRATAAIRPEGFDPAWRADGLHFEHAGGAVGRRLDHRAAPSTLTLLGWVTHVAGCRRPR